jgi:outer membrane murein-binding lipoprotein Lpp
MKYYHRLLAGLAASSVCVLLLAGCSSAPEEAGTPGPEAIVTSDCSEVQNQLEALEEQFNKLTAEYEESKVGISRLSSKYDDLVAAYDELQSDYNKLQSDCNDLQSDYKDLQTEYSTVTAMAPDLEPGDIEQALFKMINQDRADNGLEELDWDQSIYWYAQQHSKTMAGKAQLEYSEFPYYQEVHRAMGHATAQQAAASAMIMWKSRPSYPTNFLDEDAVVGVVAVERSGDIYYITYFGNTQ